MKLKDGDEDIEIRFVGLVIGKLSEEAVLGVIILIRVGEITSRNNQADFEVFLDRRPLSVAPTLSFGFDPSPASVFFNDGPVSDKWRSGLFTCLSGLGPGGVRRQSVFNQHSIHRRKIKPGGAGG